MPSSLSFINDLSLKHQLDYWQRISALEEGRNQVLRMAARGRPLNDILDTLCRNAQLHNPELRCSVLRLDNENHTLHPVAAVSLPKDYCQALDGVEIGLGVGSCGTAAFTKKRVIVEDINTHPFWVQYKSLALAAGVQSCWSEPITGQGGEIFGTFAVYYASPKAPNEEDLKFIELSANLAAVVFENERNKKELVDANEKLNQTLDERTQALESANHELSLLIAQQADSHLSHLSSEKSATANILFSGFAHEISTPIGKAFTAASALHEKVAMLQDAAEQGTLSKQSFTRLLADISQLSQLNYHGLEEAGDLLEKFKRVRSENSPSEISSFGIKQLLLKVKFSLSGLLKDYELDIDAEDFEVECNRESLWQVLYQLIENSVLHGFKDREHGRIHISAMKVGKELVINYQDDGKGLDKDEAIKLFDPFFTTSEKNTHMGLGMTTVANVLSSVLQGRIVQKPAPVGLRFEIRIPTKLY